MKLEGICVGHSCYSRLFCRYVTLLNIDLGEFVLAYACKRRPTVGIYATDINAGLGLSMIFLELVFAVITPD